MSGVNSLLVTLYQPPIAFLPAAPLLPVPDNSPVDSALLGCALGGAIETAEQLLDRLQKGVVSLGKIESEVARLEESLAGMADLLTPLLPVESSVADVNVQAHQLAVADFGALLADACAVYDSYFGVVRLHPMTLLQLAAQVARTAQAVLRDLPYTLLDRTQIVMLVANIGRMLATLAQHLPTSSGNPMPAQKSGAEMRRAYAQCWEQNKADSAEWSQTVAFYRWKVGHHFFNLCAIFCADALRCVCAAIAEGDEQTGEAQLALADSFLRGTTAAMWYAGDFPVNLYRDSVRPSMAMPGKSSGFSGDQNADYNRMKDAKERLKEFLRQAYGPHLAGLPPRLRGAFMNFHEADIEDSEHHLIIAAHKVGTDQSLAQKEWQAELPGHIHRQKAVDVLREMAESKRREF